MEYYFDLAFTTIFNAVFFVLSFLAHLIMDFSSWVLSFIPFNPI